MPNPRVNAVRFNQLIVNGAMSITSKPLCTLRA